MFYKKGDSIMFKKIFIFTALLFLATNLMAENMSQAQLERRISMLEFALAPTNPKGVATAWAEAAKNRNGAVQYMLLCPELQKANLNTLEGLNWVTGVSSPQIKGYKISAPHQKDQNWEFDIQYQLAMSGKTVGVTNDHIQVTKVNPASGSSQQWCIGKFNLLSPAQGRI
jgi:hypothetical protein